MSSNSVPARRRGRPPAAEREQRRGEALDAALAEIVERGYEAVTMLDVAQRARSSKESLYSWFGSKQALVAAVILRQAEGTNAAVRRALRDDVDPRTALGTVADALLGLLLGPVSVALNRAAMGSPELAEVLLRHGRFGTGPLIEDYLSRLHERAALYAPDPAESFRLFYGLVVQDSQIRVLLGDPPPPTVDRRLQAEAAVDRFLRLSTGTITN